MTNWIFFRYSTRDLFMKNVVSKHSFTHYPFVLECIRDVEKLFADIQAMERYVYTVMTHIFVKMVTLF